MHETPVMTKPFSLDPDRYAMIANLEYVQIAGIRTHSNALVLCRDHRPLAARPEYRYRLRGFSSSSREPTFDCEVPNDEFEIADACDPSIVVSSGAPVDGDRLQGSGYPLIHGAVMRISGWTQEAHLIASPGSHAPIVVIRFPEGTPIGTVWHELDQTVLKYWDAPYFPMRTMVPTVHARDWS